jgi:MFS transporter, PPP family, 3-phenylpropionic acid transporter
MTWLNEHFPAQLRARGQALYSIVGYGLTGVLGGLGGAMLSQHFGLQSTFMVSMGLALLAYLCANRLKAQTALSF